MATNPTVGIVFDIREFTIHDGPGLRTTVFLKGCPLRCAWCHNPEGMSPHPETIRSIAGARTVGNTLTSNQLADILNRQAELFAICGGGVTFSGGEPLAQSAFVASTIDQLKGIHVVLDTSGYASDWDFRRVAERCQLIYYDLKIISPEVHRRFTGVSNEPILRNLRTLDALDIPFVVRIPLIPGVTDTPDNLEQIARTVSDLRSIIRVDALPYNRAAGAKYGSLGKSFCPPYDEQAPVNADFSAFAALGIHVQSPAQSPRGSMGRYRTVSTWHVCNHGINLEEND